MRGGTVFRRSEEGDAKIGNGPREEEDRCKEKRAPHAEPNRREVLKAISTEVEGLSPHEWASDDNRTQMSSDVIGSAPHFHWYRCGPATASN